MPALTEASTRTAHEFAKPMTPQQADREVRGWAAVAEHLPVPALRNRIQVNAGRHVVVYDDVFATGRCVATLGDLIGAADRDPGRIPALQRLVSEIVADLVRAASDTGTSGSLRDCVGSLYLDRLRPGGRADTWYLPQARLGSDTSGVHVADLADYDIVANGHVHRVNVPETFATIRTALAGRHWRTAITQGDPTEPNIAYPLCWLDFEHAGRNSLAGDVAVLLWYLLGMGGWLVPTYQPDTYRRTLRRPRPPVATPTVDHLDLSHRHRRVSIDYTWRVGAGRRAAITTVETALTGDLGHTITSEGDVLDHLRPFLATRLLTVIPLTVMNLADALLCAVKLAQINDRALGMHELLAVTGPDS
jgi:hypothetical protein